MYDYFFLNVLFVCSSEIIPFAFYAFSFKYIFKETQFIYNIIDSLRLEGASGNVYLIGSSDGAALTYRVAVNALVTYGIKGIVAKVTQLLAEPERSGPGPHNYNVIMEKSFMSTPRS